jgi:SAM-dependent methyltransferase
LNPGEFAHLAEAEERMWWFRGQARIARYALDRFFPAGRGLQVLEAGCGTGYFSACLEREREWRMTPVDLSATGLAIGKARGYPFGVQTDLRHLPFPDGRFEAILCLDVLPHFEPGGERPALQELARVARRGAPLLIRSAAFGWLRSRHSAYVGERQRLTGYRLRVSLENSGWRIRWLTYANTLLLPVAFVKFRFVEPLLRKPPASGIVVPPPWLNSLLEWPLRIEAAAIRFGLRLPAGQSLYAVAEKV